MRADERWERIDRSLVSLERLAAGQGAFNDRLIERLDRQLDEVERQGERHDRHIDEVERRWGEQRAESKMEREALLRILERIDDIDPRASGN